MTRTLVIKQLAGWVGNDYHIRRVMPLEGNEIAQDFNLALNPSAFTAVLKAKKESQTVMTSPLSSIYGGASIGIFAPIFDDMSADKQLKVGHLLKNLPGMAYQAYNKSDWPMPID